MRKDLDDFVKKLQEKVYQGVKDNYGETALMCAARRVNTEIVELLKNAGAK